MGILPPEDRIEPDEPGRAVEIGADALVFAPDNGVFEPLVELGDSVEAGQPAARLHTPETPWAEPVLVTFPKGGFVLAKRVPGRTVRGDCLFQLATLSAILDAV
jgi:predicted deacylase